VELEECGARERDALVCGAEDDVGLWDGGVGGEEVDDGVCVGLCDRREEGGGVEGTGVEEVGRICGEGLSDAATEGKGDVGEG
jgi:hypothetical protein